jgi:hypothetical protein
MQCLLATDIDPGVLFVGTNNGVYRGQRQVDGSWTWISPNLFFNVRGLATVGAGNLRRVRAASTKEFYQSQPTASLWSPSNVYLDETTTRITALAAQGSLLYAGTTLGLDEFDQTWATNPVVLNQANETVTALASTPAQLAVALLEEVLLGAPGAFQAIGLPQSGAVVTSLHPVAGNVWLAGTAAHGLWRHDGVGWKRLFALPLVTQIAVDNNEVILFHLPVDGTVTECAVSAAASLGPPAVFSSDFPLRLLTPSNGKYPIDRKPFLVVLRNQSGATANVQVTVAATGDVAFQ